MRTWTIKRFEELSLTELYEILRIRSEVYILGQKCIYQEMDGKDQKSWHLYTEEDGEIAAYLRILDKGVSYPEISIGRVVTREKFRRKGICREMFQYAMDFVRRELKEPVIRISAQAYIQEFYESFGFVPVSDFYISAGLLHVEMLYQEEMLDIVDEQGNPTGECVLRKTAHEEGILHRTSHVWIVREKENRLQVLLQKRSRQKDSYPGCYDISSAGHIPAGADFIPSALRELKEELGVSANAGMLEYCGQRRFRFEDVFHGKKFCDNQISNIYLLRMDWEEEQFCLQKEEISEVKWFDFEECIRLVKTEQIPNCIYLEELEMVKKRVL